MSPTGSHKPNTAIAQAFYNKEAGVARLATETGAGQWGSSLAYAAALFGLEVKVYMVRVSFDQKPYRKAMMETYGATCVASPSEETNAGRAVLAEHPDSTGSLGIAIGEAVEDAATRDDTKYSLGSVLNHVLMHQSVIGREALAQFELADDYPDVVVGCTGGGSNFAGIAFPFIGEKLRGGRDVRVVAVEPAACPSLTRGRYAYDFGDTAKLTPLVKMHTLGSAFVPSGFHAGGLRYHGMAPLVSHCVQLDLVEPTAYTQLDCFEAGVQFARAESIIPAPEANHAVKGAIVEALRCKEEGVSRAILFKPLRARPFRHAGVHRLLRRQSRARALRRERSGHGPGGAAGGGVSRTSRRVARERRRPGRKEEARRWTQRPERKQRGTEPPGNRRCPDRNGQRMHADRGCLPGQDPQMADHRCPVQAPATIPAPGDATEAYRWR